MDYYTTPETVTTHRRRRATGVTLMLLPVLLTFALNMAFDLHGLWLDKAEDFIQPVSWIEAAQSAVFSLSMLCTMPVFVGGLWIFKYPLTPMSSLYTAVTGTLYCFAMLFVLYVTLAWLI